MMPEVEVLCHDWRYANQQALSVRILSGRWGSEGREAEKPARTPGYGSGHAIPFLISI